MDDRQPGLDDPEYAHFAWGHYRRLLGWMTLVAMGGAALAVTILWLWLDGDIPLHMAIATALGVGLTMWLAAALMGLVFLSSGTGHDATVIDWSRDEVDRHWQDDRK